MPMNQNVFAALPLVLILLGGCLGGSGAPKDAGAATTDASVTPSPESTAEQRTEERPELKGSKHGAIEGVVRDEFLQPVPAAHVALIGTANSTDTDKQGRFAMSAIKPGEYSLRVDHKDFVSLETPVRIEEGKATLVNVTLALVFDPNARFIGSPHRHDWWGEDKEVVIMDRDISMGTTGVCGTAVIANSCYSGFLIENTIGGKQPESRIVFSSAPDETSRPSIVFEGTGRLTAEVRVDNVLHPFKIRAKIPDRSVEGSKGVTMRQVAVVSTSTTSFEIKDILENNTDPPHFRRSAWEFYLEATTGPSPQPLALYQGKMHWKVTVHRSDRVLPVDPPHPDYWGEDTQRVLLTKTCAESRTPVSYSSPSGCNPVVPPPESTVTIGTARMKVTFTWTQTRPTPVKPGLEYLGADTVSDTYYVQWIKPPVTEDGADRRVYVFDVRSDQWDSPYVSQSDWKFRHFVDTGPPHDSAPLWEGSITYKVEIIKQA